MRNNDCQISTELLKNYFKDLVNAFFKILPMRENNEETLTTYMKSLQMELIGCSGAASSLKNDSRFMSLIGILQYLIDYPECTLFEVRREVFRAISICNKIKSVYSAEVSHEQ